MDNYEISRDRARRYFLRFDQGELVKTWNLQEDETNLYVDFLGVAYRIDRTSGAVLHLVDDVAATYDQSLSIFDLLCHCGEEKILSGTYAPVNSLRGNAAVGVTTDFYTAFAQRVDKDPENFRLACLRCGGQELPIGDMGFRFPIFAELEVQLKFYHSDEDFPASITLLWDDNMLRFVYYETVFYIASVLLRQLTEAMIEIANAPHS